MWVTLSLPSQDFKTFNHESLMLCARLELSNESLIVTLLIFMSLDFNLNMSAIAFKVMLMSKSAFRVQAGTFIIYMSG